MTVIDTIKYPEYYKTILIGYTTVYIVDELPNIHDYIDIDYKKGYVINYDINDDSKYNIYYLEKQLGDWDNGNDIYDVIYLKKY